MVFMLAGGFDNVTREDIAGFVGFGAAVLFVFVSIVVWVLAAVVRAFVSALRARRNPQIGEEVELSRRARTVLLIVFSLNMAAAVPVYHVARHSAAESWAEPVGP